jgi:hypothetical protein
VEKRSLQNSFVSVIRKEAAETATNVASSKVDKSLRPVKKKSLPKWFEVFV